MEKTFGEGYEVIGVDRIQFFSLDIVGVLNEPADKGIHIVSFSSLTFCKDAVNCSTVIKPPKTIK